MHCSRSARYNALPVRISGDFVDGAGERTGQSMGSRIARESEPPFPFGH